MPLTCNAQTRTLRGETIIPTIYFSQPVLVVVRFATATGGRFHHLTGTLSLRRFTDQPGKGVSTTLDASSKFIADLLSV